MSKFIFVLLFLLSAFSVYAETYEVKSGDTLYGILSDRFNPQEMAEINAQIKKDFKGFVLKPGMKLSLEPNKVILSAALDKDIIIERMVDGTAKVSLNEYQYDMMNVVVRGIIETNLFDAMNKAGEDAELAANLASRSSMVMLTMGSLWSAFKRYVAQVVGLASVDLSPAQNVRMVVVFVNRMGWV